MGVANVAAGFTQAFSIGASGARTAVNDAMGVRTQFAGLFAAGAVVAILLFLTGPIQYLPQAILASVIVVAGIGIVDPAAWRALAAIDRVEVAIAGVTTGCVVVFGVLEALVVAVGLSIIDTVRRSARPYDAVLGWVPSIEGYRNVAIYPTALVTPGVVVYRLDDRLFFANASYVKGRVREAIRAAPTETSWFVFDAEAVNHIDSTGMEALLDLTRDLRREDITLVVARLRSRGSKPDFDVAGLTDEIGARALLSVRQARRRGVRGSVERRGRLLTRAGSRFWQDPRGATPDRHRPRGRRARRRLPVPRPLWTMVVFFVWICGSGSCSRSSRTSSAATTSPVWRRRPGSSSRSCCRSSACSST